MSKIVKVETKLIDGQVLVAALSQLKITVRSVAENYSSIYAFTKNGAFNFERQKNGTYALNYHHSSVDQGESRVLLKKLLQQYALLKIKKETEKAGYSIVKTENLENNTIKMVVRKWQAN